MSFSMGTTNFENIAVGSKDSGSLMSRDRPVEGLLVLAVAVLIWYCELKRRCGVRNSSGLGVPNASKMLRICAPEVAALVSCFGLIAWLVSRGGTYVSSSHTRSADEFNEAVWNEIRREWPLLMCADSLLAVQATIKFLVFASASLRPRIGSVLFANGPAAILLFAGLTRSAVLMMGDGSHWLDGPLGGRINVAVEVASLLPLLWLSKGCFRQCPRMLMAVLLVASRIALHNWIVLTEGAFANTAFSFAHVLDMFAAIVFVLRFLANVGERQTCAVAGFVHVLLVAQQALGMYYFLYCFLEATDEVALPELVGGGKPFEMLQIGGVMQLSMYTLAGALHFVMPDDEP